MMLGLLIMSITVTLFTLLTYYHILNGTMILFQLHERTDGKTIHKLKQKFYGQDSSSWKARYMYRRHCFIEDIPHRKIMRSVVILKKEDREKVLEFLSSYSLTLHLRKVILSPEDEEILRRFQLILFQDLNHLIDIV